MSIGLHARLDNAISASKINSLFPGDLGDRMADDPHEKIKLKSFHAAIVNDNEQLNNKLLITIIFCSYRPHS